MESETTDYDPLKATSEILANKRYRGFIMQPKSSPLVLWARARISANAIMLFQLIANSIYFDPSNEKYLQCPFSASQLAEMTGKSRNSISKWLTELKSAGLIERASDGVIVMPKYGILFNDRRSGNNKFAFKENFNNAWSELFPPLAEKLRQRTENEQSHNKKD
jgi:DNA-binding transcriptional ArsR family regulator